MNRASNPGADERIHRLRDFDLCAMADHGCVIGVDEAGRGALAGPVVAAAVGLNQAFYESAWCLREAIAVDDSKRVNKERRETLFAEVGLLARKGLISCACGVGSVEEIQKLNILGATRLAMERALCDLNLKCIAGSDHLPQQYYPGDTLFAREREPALGGEPLILVDGNPLRPFPFAHRAVVRGDGRSLAIAMASIVAKVTRDTSMRVLDREFPQFCFADHKGYGTCRHQAAILKYGPCPVHRFRFLRKLLGPEPHERQVSITY